MDFSNYSPALVLVIVVALALAPFVAVMVTSFTKIVVVLSLLRNALGLQQVPPNVVINGLAIVLSIYVMYPVILDTHGAITARMEGKPPPPSVQAQLDARAASQAARQRMALEAAQAQAQPTAADDAPPASPAAADALRAEAEALARQERGELFRNVTGGIGPEPAADDADAPPAPAAPAQTHRALDNPECTGTCRLDRPVHFLQSQRAGPWRKHAADDGDSVPAGRLRTAGTRRCEPVAQQQSYGPSSPRVSQSAGD